MTHALTDHGRLLRLPKSVLERRRAIADARAQLVNAGHRPTAGALAEATQLTVDEVVAAMDAPTTIASLDAPLTDRPTLEALWPTQQQPSPGRRAREPTAQPWPTQSITSARQRAVIDARFGLNGEPKTLTEIGAELRVSAARVRAIESDALSDLALELDSAHEDP